MILQNYQQFNESKQVGLLYHLTNIEKVFPILKDNILKSYMEFNPKWLTLINAADMSAESKYISLTRNKNMKYQPVLLKHDLNVRLELNGDKLSNKYKIIPFKYDIVNVGDEMEERIPTPIGISNIQKYITSITIFTNEDINLSPILKDDIHSILKKTKIDVLNMSDIELSIAYIQLLTNNTIPILIDDTNFIAFKSKRK